MRAEKCDQLSWLEEETKPFVGNLFCGGVFPGILDRERFIRSLELLIMLKSIFMQIALIQWQSAEDTNILGDENHPIYIHHKANSTAGRPQPSGKQSQVLAGLTEWPAGIALAEGVRCYRLPSGARKNN